jgi:hypothetical protein
VALPILLGIGMYVARGWAGKLSNRALDRLMGTGLAAYLLAVGASAWPMIDCPHPPFPMMPPSWLLLPFHFSHPFCTPARMLFLLAAVGIVFCFLRVAPSRRNANRALLLLLSLWVILLPSRFYAPSEINDDMKYIYHLNSVLDALSQSVDGHHLLIDFPHIYGGYVEILAPFIRMLPTDMGTLIAALAVPSVIGMLCLLLTARLVVRQPALFFLCGLALLGIGYLITAHDLAYGYVTARWFFPPMGLLAATLYFRRPTMARHGIATGLAATAPIWNLDTGLVLWASWLGTLVIMALVRRDFAGALRHLLVQAASFAAAWTAFFIYLRIVSGQWPDLGMLFYFQKLVLGAGYFCLGLAFPDVWCLVVMLYVISLAVVLHASLHRRTNGLTPVTLMISLLGIGSFSYFMGRSAESNLVAVCFPAILLLGILSAEGDALIARRRLPAGARYFVVPAKITLFWWSFLLVAALPDLLHSGVDVVRHWQSETPTPLEANAAFIRQRVQPREPGVFFLSNDSGIYYYLSGTVRPLKIPGMIELLEARDMNVLLEAIRRRQIAELFIEQNFYLIEMYRPDVYDAIRRAVAANYTPVATGPSDQLILYTPR